MIMSVSAPYGSVWGDETRPAQGAESVPTAGPAAIPPDAPADKPAVAESEPPAVSKKKLQARRSIEWGGRIFVRNTLSQAAEGEPTAAAGWTNDLGVDSARVGLEYKDRKLDLEIELEAELAGKDVEMRDAYLRWDTSRSVRLQLGSFKQPIGAVTLASRWSLPVIERGLLNDLQRINALTTEPDELPVGGRNIGAMVVLRGRDMPLQPRLSLAVFRSRVHDQLAESLGENRVPIGLSDGFPEDLYARLEVEPVRGLELGASVGWLAMLEFAGTRDSFTHGLVLSLDAVAELGPVRMWLEGFLGDSPIHLGTQMVAEGKFMAARGIVSTPFAVRRGPLAYLEPYASAQYLDVSDRVEDDTAHELAGGVTAGFTDSWRVQLGYERRALDNRLNGGGSRIIVQAGADF